MPGNHVAASTELHVESRALAKGIQLIGVLAESAEPQTLSELSRRINLGKASTSRLLRTLLRTGHVVQLGDQTYQLARSSPSVDIEGSLIAAAREEMEALAAQVAETVSLAVLRDDLIRIVDTIDSPHEMRVSNPVGRVLAPYASSLGKAVAAWQLPEVLDRLIVVFGIYKITEHTITDLPCIRQHMALIRERGYSSEREESVLGGCCYGTPIFRGGRNAVGAISVAMPLIRATPENERRIPEVLRAAAARISARLEDR